MNRWLAFLIWTCAYLGALSWFVVWSVFWRNYVHSEAARIVAGLTGLIPLLVLTWAWALRDRVDRHPVFRKAFFYCSASLGLLMLCGSVYVHIRG